MSNEDNTYWNNEDLKQMKKYKRDIKIAKSSPIIVIISLVILAILSHR